MSQRQNKYGRPQGFLPNNSNTQTQHWLSLFEFMTLAQANQKVADDKPKHSNQQLRRRLENLKPWRMSIQINEEINTREFLELPSNRSNPLQQQRDKYKTKFFKFIDTVFPNGFDDKRFLDCGCNAAAYCFWARERNAENCFGFDIREHWIRQAKFVRFNRTMGPKTRIQLEVLDLYDLGSQNLDPFDLVHFKNLFYHLPDPISGLKIAADLSRDVLYFNSSFCWERPDGALVVDPRDNGEEENDWMHGGTDSLNWLPTGPGVCADIIRSFGFEEIKLTNLKQIPARPERGRLEIVAARETKRLLGLNGQLI